MARQTLKEWCEQNGDYGQQLLQEWDYFKNEKEQLFIDAVSRGSKLKVWWKCSRCNNEWYADLAHRTNEKFRRGCPKCNCSNTSYPEQFIHWSLKQLFPNTQNRVKLFKSSEHPRGIEFDIVVPDIPLYIEYSSTKWHGHKTDMDKLKIEICKQQNIRFINIIDDCNNELENTFEKDLIIMKINGTKNQEEIIISIVEHILKSLGYTLDDIDLQFSKDNAWKYSRGYIEIEKTLSYKYPRLAEEWHPVLNGAVQPDNITCGSVKEVYWKCPDCGYGENGEWKKPIPQRVTNGKLTGCPRCKRKWYEGSDITYVLSTVVEQGVNDLRTTHPELAKEWHSILNTIDLNDIGSTYLDDVYWQCIKCNFGENGEWLAPPNRRAAKGYETGCPACGYHWNDNQYHRINNKLFVKGFNDLATTHPELAKEWHPTLNDCEASDVKSGSRDKRFWQCINCNYGENGEWLLPPGSRTTKGRETGCPSCGYNWYKAQEGIPQKFKKMKPKSKTPPINNLPFI